MDAIKSTFVARALHRFNSEAIDHMRITAKRMGIGVTEQGLQSLAYRVSGMSSTMSFHEYLRFVDMGAGRGHPLGGLALTKIQLQASNKSGAAQIKDKTRKPKKFYSKIAYGKLGSLYGELLYGYTEETIDMLKKELQAQNIVYGTN